MMIDLWTILSISLAASLTAGLLLSVKALFHDKLNARWHYLIWCVLLVRLFVPVNQRVFVTPLSLFQTVPLPKAMYLLQVWIERQPGLLKISKAAGGIYLAGVAFLFLFYSASYLRLRIRIRQGEMPEPELKERIGQIAADYGLRACREIRICSFASSPFVAGLFHPVLVLPKNVQWEDEQIEKMVLHELLHVRYFDVAVNFLLHLIRILNWFNPFLWFVLARIQNDNEALCDQRVLERLGKEDHKEYGRLLLAMAEQEAPPDVGTTSMANGFRNIRRRLLRIADFGHVPKGNTLVSLCITLILILACVGFSSPEHSFNTNGVIDAGDWERLFFRAQFYDVSTPEEALNIYMKALETKNAGWMALVLPEEERESYESWVMDLYSKAGLNVSSLMQWKDGDGSYFPTVFAEASYYMRVLDFSEQQENEYSAKIGFYQEVYGEEPEDWKIGLKLKKDYDWAVYPSEVKPLAEHTYHSFSDSEPVIKITSEGENFLAELNFCNEVGFSNIGYGGWFLSGDAAEQFETDFSLKYKCTQLKVDYQGEKDLTGQNLTIWYGPPETAESIDGNIYSPNSSGGSSDGSGWSSMKIPEDWDGSFDTSSGVGNDTLWSETDDISYIVRIFLDKTLVEEFVCETGGVQ